MRRVVLIVGVFLFSLETSAQLQVPELNVAVTVDGRLDEQAWAQALLVDLPYEVEPGDSLPAIVRTDCLLFSTNEALYVGFRAYDPNPSEVRAHVSDRDQFFRDDFVGVILDTFADRRRAFQFLVNPMGVQGDAVRTVTPFGEDEDFRWDAVWQADAQLTPFGYQVEIRIPFSALRFAPGQQEKHFGFAALRSYPRSLRRTFFSQPMNRDNPCSLCQLATIAGFFSARPGRQVELNPTWVAARTQERADLADPFMSPPTKEGEAGASLLWGVTPNISVNLTLNPDFSQVEADAKKFSINRVFTLFFPEKRPFFLEGSDYFTTPLQAVYTRTMADPDWGVKITGKEKNSAFGLLAVRDSITPLILPGSQTSTSLQLPLPSTALIGRYRHDLGRASNLGLLFTRRQGRAFTSQAGGWDGLVRLSTSSTLSWQWLWSSTEYPNHPDLAEQAGTRHQGSAWEASFSHATRHWEAWAWARRVDEGFRADLGFLPMVGVQGGEVGGQRIFWGKEGGWFSRLAVGAEVQRFTDQRGKLLEETSRLMGRYHGPLQSTVFLTLFHYRKGWQNREFSGRGFRVFANVRFSGDLTASCGVEGGDAIDYSGNRPATRWEISPGFTLNLGRHLYLQGDFSAERLAVAGGELYRAWVGELRVVYYFNVRSFLRLLTQHSYLRTYPWRFPEPPEPLSREWRHQLLFAYKLSPQTLLYVGAGDEEAGNHQVAAATTQRSLFLKLSYQWQI